MRLRQWWTGRAAAGPATPTRAALAIVAMLASVGAAVAPAAARVAGGGRVAGAAALTVAELGTFAAVAVFLLAGLRGSARAGLVVRPVLLGALPGTFAGAIGAPFGAGEGPDLPVVAWGLGAGAAVAAGCAVAARWGHARASARGLDEPAPRRRLTLVLALLAAVGADFAANGPAIPGLVLVPGLVALAFGLLVAAVTGPAAARLAARVAFGAEPVALPRTDAAVVTGPLRPHLYGPEDPPPPEPPPRHGRLRVAAVAAISSLARRRELHRIVALGTVAVAACGAALLGWTSTLAAREHRAALELGADRVVTVAPVGPRELLRAVRRADPDGRYAMAVTVRHTGSTGDAPAPIASPTAYPAAGIAALPVVAVDSTRLPSVLAAGYGGAPGTDLLSLIKPAATGVRVLVAGLDPGATGTAALVDPFGAGGVRVTVAAGVTVLPRVAEHGVLIDLGDSIGVAGDVDSPVTDEVWLAPGAPEEILAGLRDNGLRVAATRSIAGVVADLGRGRAVVALRLQLLDSTIALAIAGVVLYVVVRSQRGARTLARGLGLVAAMLPGGLVGAIVAHAAGPHALSAVGVAGAAPPVAYVTSFALASGAYGVAVLAAVTRAGRWRRVVPARRSAADLARSSSGGVSAR